MIFQDVQLFNTTVTNYDNNKLTDKNLNHKEYFHQKFVSLPGSLYSKTQNDTNMT